MSTRDLRPGQRVKCNIRGRQFWAQLVEPDPEVRGGWIIDPPRGITYHHVTARQIKEVEKRWTPERAVVRTT